MPANALFILADDLTGAADSAIGAAKAGLRSIVVFETVASVEAEVIAIDADSRYRPAAEARALNVRLWTAHRAPGRLFYKKIDSTLRGNFAAEIAALAESTEAGFAIVAPAFPSNGRVTRGGRVFVKGVPLEQTETWANEGLRGEADIAALLGRAGVKAAKLDLATVRGDTLREAFIRLLDAGEARAVVCDAENEDDLAAIAAASVELPAPCYWVGSSGLAAHLLHAAGIAGKTAASTLAVDGPVLAVVGSVSGVSRRQIARLEARADFAVFVPDAESLRAGEADPAWRSLQSGIDAALRDGRDVILRTALGERNDLSQGRALSDSIARMIAPLAGQVGALIVTGGETARALLPVFGAHALQLVREVEAGVPLSVSIGRRAIPVVTKAGAFGTPEAFVTAYAMLAAARGGLKASSQNSPSRNFQESP